jgi:hypothetical protein
VSSVRDYFREYRAKKKHVSMAWLQQLPILLRHDGRWQDVPTTPALSMLAGLSELTRFTNV